MVCLFVVNLSRQSNLWDSPSANRVEPDLRDRRAKPRYAIVHRRRLQSSSVTVGRFAILPQLLDFCVRCAKRPLVIA